MKKYFKIILLVIGILLIILGVFLIFYNKENSLNIMIYDFHVSFNESSNINVGFYVRNNDDKNIKKEKLLLNFYNDKKLLYTNEYTINLGPYDESRYDGGVSFDFDKVTKYEFVYQGMTKVMVPINDQERVMK